MSRARTFAIGGSGLYASEAFLELVLRAVELRKGARQVLELFLELLLDLRELLGLEGVEVDFTRAPDWLALAARIGTVEYKGVVLVSCLSLDMAVVRGCRIGFVWGEGEGEGVEAGGRSLDGGSGS